MTLEEKLEAIKPDIQAYKRKADQIEMLTMQMDVIKTNIKAVLEEANSKELECPGYGRFTLETRRSFSYENEPKVAEFAKLLEEAKDLVKANGTAKVTETTYLRYHGS